MSRHEKLRMVTLALICASGAIAIGNRNWIAVIAFAGWAVQIVSDAQRDPHSEIRDPS